MPAPGSLPLYNNNLKSLGHYSQPVFMLVFQIHEVFICLFRTEKGFSALLKNLNLPSWQLGRQVTSSRDSSGLMTGIVPLQGSSSKVNFSCQCQWRVCLSLQAVFYVSWAKSCFKRIYICQICILYILYF